MFSSSSRLRNARRRNRHGRALPAGRHHLHRRRRRRLRRRRCCGCRRHSRVARTLRVRRPSLLGLQQEVAAALVTPGHSGEGEGAEAGECGRVHAEAQIRREDGETDEMKIYRAQCGGSLSQIKLYSSHGKCCASWENSAWREKAALVV